MRSPPTTPWSRTSAVRLLAVLPRRQRVHDVLGRELEWVDGRVLAVLHLLQDGAHAGVLALVVEFHACPRHDELLAGDVRAHERLAYVFGIRRLRAVDGVGERQKAGEGARRHVGQVTAALLLEELVHLPDQRLLGGEVEGERRARDVTL